MSKPNETFVGIVSEERSIDFTRNSLPVLKIGFVIAGVDEEDNHKAIDDFVDAVDEFVENYNENNNK